MKSWTCAIVPPGLAVRRRAELQFLAVHRGTQKNLLPVIDDNLTIHQLVITTVIRLQDAKNLAQFLVVRHAQVIMLPRVVIAN